MPDITVFFLFPSRSVRVVWVLEELGLPYKVEMWARVKDTLDRAAFDAQSKAPVGRYPILHDGKLVLPETGAIVEYGVRPPASAFPVLK
jgi:glutathione S-transferase